MNYVGSASSVFWSAEQETHLHTYIYVLYRINRRRWEGVSDYYFCLFFYYYYCFYCYIRTDIHIEFSENIYHTIRTVALANGFFFCCFTLFLFFCVFLLSLFIFIFSCLVRSLRFFPCIFAFVSFSPSYSIYLVL